MWTAIEKYVNQSEACQDRKGLPNYARPLRTLLQSSQTSKTDINPYPQLPRKNSSWTSRPLEMKFILRNIWNYIPSDEVSYSGETEFSKTVL